jgi:predicted RNA-binding protein YlqC (UPF0109 family)
MDINKKEGHMRELLAEVAKRLVDHPEQVTINEIHGATTLILELSVAKQDLGKIIGKRGRTIAAIRTIMMAASAKIHKRIIVEVEE